MKKWFFVTVVFLFLVPFFLFVKSWYDKKEPIITIFKFQPSSKKMSVGKELRLQFEVLVPLHLEIEKIKLDLPKEIIETQELEINKVWDNNKKLIVTTTLVAVQPFQLKEIKIHLIAKGLQEFNLLIDGSFSFENEKDNQPFEQKLVSHLSESKQVFFHSINWLLWAIILTMVIGIIFIGLYFLKPKKVSAYKIILKQLNKFNGDNYELETILFDYFDAQFSVKLSSATIDQKIIILKDLPLEQQFLEELIEFVERFEANKFLPQSQEVSAISITKLIEVIKATKNYKEKV